MAALTDELVIEPGRAEKNYWKDIWRYRELFYILSWRDIKVRYKQTVIGAAWGVIRPLLTMLIFTFVFGKVASLASSTSSTPYAIIVFAGLLPWQFFSTALSEASNSLLGNANLISKVYFPRMIVPASSVITSLVDFAISFGLLLLIIIYYKYPLSLNMLLLPVFIIMAFLLAFGVGLYVTALNVKYRDFRYVVPFIVQLGLYVTPVGYSSSVIAERYSGEIRFWFSFNPVVGIIDGFRWCIVGEPMYWPGFYLSLGMILFFMWLGIWYFRKTEKTFADNI
ncbi:phosphate ABC transporter permease [Niastella vici]|uniref:Transport permease protein n=1 Tax=Niastella vici TaxID=1703345 RepID=A0A1V9G8E6_9BACT|nr:ABC transporter permease [Niastella vici]OQP66905.1 phosphate ABC transporter permease [Niastella vici]